MKTKDKIKKLCRQKYDMSLTEYEQRLGFGNGSLSKNGFLRSDRLLKVANDLGVEMESLMDDDLRPEQSGDDSPIALDYTVETPGINGLSSIEIEMVDAYRAADHDMQSIVEIALKLRRPKD